MFIGVLCVREICMHSAQLLNMWHIISKLFSTLFFTAHAYNSLECQVPADYLKQIQLSRISVLFDNFAFKDMVSMTCSWFMFGYSHLVCYM